jgi:hypothetical protein
MPRSRLALPKTPGTLAQPGPGGALALARNPFLGPLKPLAPSQVPSLPSPCRGGSGPASLACAVSTHVLRQPGSPALGTWQSTGKTGGPCLPPPTAPSVWLAGRLLGTEAIPLPPPGELLWLLCHMGLPCARPFTPRLHKGLTHSGLTGYDCAHAMIRHSSSGAPHPSHPADQASAALASLRFPVDKSLLFHSPSSLGLHRVEGICQSLK